MPSVVGVSLMILKMVALSSILLVLTAWGTWGLSRALGRYWYFPSRSICLSVHKNFPRWVEREKKVAGTFEPPTVRGLLATAMLVAIAALNVSLLAQVFELFVPAGERLVFPLIGSYATFPLIVGVLFALVQVTLSTIRKMRLQQNERARFAFSLMALSVLIETGLNLYRSSLLMSGQEAIAPTVWDQVSAYGGPVLAGLLGFLVPCAEMMASPFALLEFIMPFIRDIAVSIRTIVGWTLLVGTWLLFGFHSRSPVTLPGPFRRLQNELKCSKASESALQKSVRRLRKTASKLRKPRPGIDELEADLRALKDRFEAGIVAIHLHVADFDNAIASISDKNGVRQTRSRIRDWSNRVLADLESPKAGVRALKREVRRVSSAYGKWSKRHEMISGRVEEVRDLARMVDSLASRDSSVTQLCRGIRAVLSGDGTRNSILPEIEVAEILILCAPTKGLDTHEEAWRKSIVSECQGILERAESWSPNALTTIATSAEFLQKLDSGLSGAQVSGLNGQQSHLSGELATFRRNIGNGRKALAGQLGLWRNELRSRARRLRAAYLYLQLSLPWQRI